MKQTCRQQKLVTEKKIKLYSVGEKLKDLCPHYMYKKNKKPNTQGKDIWFQGHNNSKLINIF